MRLKETVRTDYYTQIGRLVCSPQKQTVVHIQDKVNTKLFLPAALFRGRHKEFAYSPFSSSFIRAWARAKGSLDSHPLWLEFWGFFRN